MKKLSLFLGALMIAGASFAGTGGDCCKEKKEKCTKESKCCKKDSKDCAKACKKEEKRA